MLTGEKFRISGKIFELQRQLLGTFSMSETCENWLGPVNSYVYHAQHSCKIYKVLPYPVALPSDFKAPRKFWNQVS